MRFLLHVTPCPKRFNELVRSGESESLVKKILDDLKPEASYFAEFRGRRSWIMVVELPNSASIPRFAEPFFLKLDAEVEFHPMMTIQDLAEANLGDLGKKWG